MNEGEALYKAILANPHEDTPRLAYADWLDENRPDKAPSPAAAPSARAEFIRVQCRLADMTPDDPAYTELLDREADLGNWLGTHAPEKQKFPAGLQDDNDDFERGFPCQASSEYGEGNRKAVARLCAALEKAATTTTISTLRLYAYTGSQMAELLRHPATAGLRTLFLQPTSSEGEGTFFDLDDTGDIAEWRPNAGDGAAEEIARALAESPHVRNLRELRLFFDLTEAAAEILARAKHLDGLASLTLEPAAGSPGVLRTLATAGWFRNLRALRIQESLPDPVAVALADLPPMPNLRALQLWGNSFSPDGLARLAASKSFPNLLVLELGGMTLEQRGIAALAKAKWRPAVLGLRACDLGNAGAEALAASRLLEGVRIIDIATNGIGTKGAKALAGSPRLASLRHLDLSYNPLGKRGLLAVANSPHLRNLTRLALSVHWGDPPRYAVTELTEFLARLDMPNLRHLALDELPVGASGARVIAKSPAFGRLTSLSLKESRIGDGGLAALVASPHLKGLIDVQLYRNGIKESVAALADRNVWPLLSQCGLYNNPIPRAVAKRLKRRPGVRISTD